MAMIALRSWERLIVGTEQAVPEAITFEQAINLTQSLLRRMVAGEISSAEIEEVIAGLVKTENGARGFFVTYLTSDEPLADHPSPEVVKALQSSPNIVAELLVKNLAMSAALALTHSRQQNAAMAQSSDRVRVRTAHLMQLVKLPQVASLAQQLWESAATGEGNYKAFLQRWSYDAEQRQVICQVLEPVFTAS